MAEAGCGPLAVAAAQDGPDPCLELGEGEGLDDEIVGSQVEHADPDVLGVPAGAHDHRNGAVATNLGQDVGAVEAGEPEIEEHETGRVLEDRLQGRGPIGGLRHPVSRPLEILDESAPAAVIVLGHQNRPVPELRPDPGHQCVLVGRGEGSQVRAMLRRSGLRSSGRNADGRAHAPTLSGGDEVVCVCSRGV